MSFWEIVATIATAAGLFASILGAWLTYAARKNGEATRSMMQGIHRETRELLAQMEQRAEEGRRRTSELLAQMEQRAEEGRREASELLARMDQRAERMDQRADERQREVIAVIQALGKA